MGYVSSQEGNHPHAMLLRCVGKGNQSLQSELASSCDAKPSEQCSTVVKNITKWFQSKIYPWNLTWNLRIQPWKRRNIFQSIIFRFYVNLGGCISANIWGKLHQIMLFYLTQSMAEPAFSHPPDPLDQYDWIYYIYHISIPSFLLRITSWKLRLPEHSGK